MGAPSAGTVVLVTFPFSDLSGAKLRPAVVLAAAGFGDCVLCQITSNAYADPKAVRLLNADFASGSLRRESFVRPGKLFTASPRLISTELGNLSTAKFNEVYSAVMKFLASGRNFMNPYHHFVSEYARFAKEGKDYQLGGFPKCPPPEVSPGTPNVLIFSPHPDDEVIIGGLALRLLREARWNVVNVAITQGSKKERQAGRLQELKNCCDCIGFGLVQTAPTGLEKINPKTREQDPAHWAQCVKVVADILARHQPRVVLFPHAADWNSTHIGTHFLVLDALKTLPANFTCYTVETEFWGAMTSPNLMIEISPQDLGDLITALTFHVGEVQRNPYHLTLSAWMIDNVRRGGEVVGGQGAAVPDFTFATLYRLRKWSQGRLEEVYQGGRNLACDSTPAQLFP